MALRDQEKRTVEVNRQRLLDTLRDNKEKHVVEYEEAMAGYKAVLLEKIEQAFSDAKKQLEERYEKIKSKVEKFTDADIAKQHDAFLLVEEVAVEMKVPRSYEKDYNAAIDMAHWDVRETLELTHAEFNCFVRDQWDWKSGFEAVSMMYKAKMIT